MPRPAPVSAAPAVQVWPRGSLGSWTPPPCSGWNAPGFRSLIAVSGHFQMPGGVGTLLQRFGAVSQTAGIRYWSTTTKSWQTLIRHAQALEKGQPRADFPASDFVPGRSLAFRQTDSSSGTADFQMTVLARTPTQLVLEVENTTTVRMVLLPLFHAGDLQSLYDLEQQPDQTWLYYNLVRIGVGASALTDGHDASTVNRAIAWFRHIAGLLTDQEPPAAR